MAMHLRKRKDRGGVYCLVDGRTSVSLKTTKAGLAKELLEKAIRERRGLAVSRRIGEFYAGWIVQMEKDPERRRAWLQNARSAFTRHILPEFKAVEFSQVNYAKLDRFKSKMLAAGLSLESARAVMNRFRALWKDARKQEVVQNNPFELLSWPSRGRALPDPFTPSERDRIVAYFAKVDPHYYPLVKLLADTGMRPSEAGALRWTDVDLRACEITITRSRNCGEDFPRPKTKKSQRTIDITPELAAMLGKSHTRLAGEERVFVNKLGGALDTNHWAGDNWRPALIDLGIRWRKFYALRHTHITEFVQEGYELLSIARYHGTSIAMIEDNYCGALKMVKAEMRKAG